MVHLALVAELGQSPDGLGEGHARVGAVELVQIDGLHVEGGERGLAGGPEMLRATVDDPGTVAGADVASLGGDEDLVPAGPAGTESLGHQSLVVAGVGTTGAVGVGGVDEGDPCLEGGVDGTDGPGAVRPALE